MSLYTSQQINPVTLHNYPLILGIKICRLNYYKTILYKSANEGDKIKAHFIGERFL